MFFRELLPKIDHLGELKVCLYLFWRLDRMEGTFRYLRREDFAGDERLMQGLGDSQERAQAALDESLERAVARGTLIRASVAVDQKQDQYYFLNSPRGRAASMSCTTWMMFRLRSRRTPDCSRHSRR